MSSSDSAQDNRTILLLSIAAFASSASMRVCDAMLPRMAADFGVSLPQVSAVIAFFSVAYGVLQIVYGPIGDRLGKFRVISVATLLAALASILCALAPTLNWLIAARFGSGAIAAAIIPLSFAWIGDTIPYERRQPVLARFLSGSILGVILGQLLGGSMADSFGWRAAFGVLAAVFFAAAALMLRNVAQMRPVPAAPSTSPASPPSSSGSGLLARSFGPYLQIARGAWVRRILSIVAIEGFLVFGAIAFVPAWLHQRHGLSLWAAGLISAVFALGGLTYTMLAARLLVKLGEQGLALGGGLVLAVGLLLMGLAPNWPLTVAASLLMGLGFYGMHNTLQTHGTQLAPTQRGTGMAMFALFYFLGQSIGVSLASWIVGQWGFVALFTGYGLAISLLAGVFARALRRRLAAAMPPPVPEAAAGSVPASMAASMPAPQPGSVSAQAPARTP